MPDIKKTIQRLVDKTRQVNEAAVKAGKETKQGGKK